MPVIHTTEIRYGNAGSYFSFAGMPTPFMSRSEENVFYNGKWAQTTTLTLNGTIVGKNYNNVGDTNARELNQDRNAILDGFNEDFQSLWVVEDSTTVITFEGCVVKSISFSPANYGIQEYSIELTCYNQNTFKEFFGVTDPVNKVSFTEEDDGTVSISHEVSAAGFPTTGSYSNQTAIQNAVSFVEARTGYSTATVLPAFMHNLQDSQLVLTSLSKDIDRAAGTYAFSADYKMQTGAIDNTSDSFTLGVINNIETNLSSGASSDFNTVGVTWKVQGGKDMSAASLRGAVPTTGALYSAATGGWNIGGLMYVPNSYSISDNATTEKIITVSAEFDDDTRTWNANGIFFDYNVSVDTDDVTDRAQVNIDGEFLARGTFNNRFSIISGYYYGNVANDGAGKRTSGYLYELANSWYTGVNYNMIYGNTAWALNPMYESLSVDVNELAGTIKLSASFNNKDYKLNYKEAEWSVSINPSLLQYVAKPSCNLNGLYGIYNLNTLTRASITLNGRFTPFASDLWGQARYGGPGADAWNSQAGLVPLSVPSQEIHDYASSFSSAVFATLNQNDVVIEKQSTDTSPGPLYQLNFSETLTYNGDGF